MKILAFESSCDETAAAVVERKDGSFSVLSNVVASQIDVHKLYGGVVPEIAGRAHIEAVSRITYEALQTANTSVKEIELIAVTAQPGLIGALLVAVNFAKSLAVANGIPLVAVDHIKGHIAAAYLLGEAPTPPFIGLAVSGGHTALYRAGTYTDYEVIGTTRDDAIGESFDKIGRLLGIPYPAGAGFDALATEGFIKATGNPDQFYSLYKKSAAYKDPEMRLPSPALRDGSYDFSFSGLKTAAINYLHRKEEKKEEVPADLFAARYTFEAVEAVASQVDAALKNNPGVPLAVAGGVAANSHLRRRLTEVAKKRGVTVYIPEIRYCGDNAAMIAAQGYYEFEAGNRADSSLNASALDSIV